ncbi:hypothetical protein ACIOEX_22835 [Streptomyces sp. NPDC087850]|uniref:hypothetical protein n=1 Tax=Streptomyces sp. NPDC087850 TaxID=3365809 RepID=UPI0038220F56
MLDARCALLSAGRTRTSRTYTDLTARTGHKDCFRVTARPVGARRRKKIRTEIRPTQPTEDRAKSDDPGGERTPADTVVSPRAPAVKTP